MWKLLWLLPLAIIALAAWLLTLLPQPVLAGFGYVALLAVVVAMVGLLVMWLWSEAMKA